MSTIRSRIISDFYYSDLPEIVKHEYSEYLSGIALSGQTVRTCQLPNGIRDAISREQLGIGFIFFDFSNTQSQTSPFIMPTSRQEPQHDPSTKCDCTICKNIQAHKFKPSAALKRFHKRLGQDVMR